jgi:hypothetical protein
MKNTSRSVGSLLSLIPALGLVLGGCAADGADNTGNTSPDAVVGEVAPLSGGAGGGGAGGGGGGGGGAAGGGVTPPKTGAIKATSAVVTCSDGTILTVNLKKDVANFIQLQVLVTSAVAAPPAGYMDLALVNAATGTFLNGVGSWPQAFVAGLSITNRGTNTIPVGNSTLSFSGIVHDGNTAAGAPLVTCAASITVVAN